MRRHSVDIALLAHLGVFCLVLTAMPAAGRDYFVDKKNPAAADTNAGTQAEPLKTIQAAVDKAKAGDNVEIRAGVYHEAVKFKEKSGKRFGARSTYWADDNTQYVTIEAFGNERVILDGTIEVKDFRLVEGKRNVYVAPFVCKGFQKRLVIVFAGDEQFMPFQKRNPKANVNQPDFPLLPAIPDDGPQDRGWYYDKKKDLLYVNLGGPAPGKDVPIRAAEMNTGVDAANSYFPRIRKLEIHGYNEHCVVIYNTLGAMVEDNYLHHAPAGIWGGPSMDVSICRNTVAHTEKVAMCLGGNLGGVVESNVIRDYHVNPFKTRTYAGGIMCNGITGTALRFNVVTHPISPAAGMWPDCNGLGNAWYGNVLYRINNACGFYIEAGSVGTVLRWNHCFENWGGIMLRQNYMNVACENYLHDNTGVGMGISTPAGDNNIANYFGDNVIVNNPTGIGTGVSADKTIANTFDRNTYVLPKGGRVMQIDDKQFKTIKDVRTGVGEEMHGKVVEKFDPASLGLVSFRVFGTDKNWEPVQMYGNPGMERYDVLKSFNAPYFWDKGTFRESSVFGWTCVGISDNGTPSTIQGTNGFIRHLDPRNLSFIRNYPGGKVGGGNIEDAKAHSGNYLVQVGAIPGKRLSDRGLGFWSPALPTLPGAKVDVSLWMERSGIEPTDAEMFGGVYVFVQWTNITGQHTSRSYIVGGENFEEARQLEMASGTGPYTNVKGAVTAPAGAVWMRLAFGMRSASGWASFDDVDIHTQPGRQIAQSTDAVPLDATQFDWQSVDLAGVVNRALIDERASDGEGGWTGQGPEADMRNLPTGAQVLQGVPYTILPAAKKAVVVLRSPQRPQSVKLPQSVDIPVHAKAAAIAFLHSGAWVAADAENWRYVVQYADGSEEVVRMIGRKNIADWTDTFKDNDFNQDLAAGWTRTAITVHSSKYPNVSLYGTIWSNPHPGATIKSIKMTAAGNGVPLLVAISLGSPKASGK